MLYIRDAADIGGIVKPNLPPLTPAVPAVVASVDRTRLAEQWSERWAQATGPEHFTGIGLEATTSPTFESTPELRVFYEELFERAVRWCKARSGELAEFTASEQEAGRMDSVSDLVKEWEQETGRKSAPFDLTIYFVPVEGRAAWEIANDRYLVSVALATDRRAYDTWLRPIIAEAASR
jgi:hypothetical protein